MTQRQIQTADSLAIFVARPEILSRVFFLRMVLKYKDKDIATLDEIQKLKAKDLRDILKSHSETTGGMKADLVLKVYALLMRYVLPSSNANSGENEEVPSPQEQEQGQDECDFKYEETIRRISALGWSSDLQDLPEMNFIQLYDYLHGYGKCNHVGGVLFAIEDFIRRGLQHNPEPLTCTSRLSVWVVPRNQSVGAKPLDKVLIRKIRLGKKNIRTQPKIINFDPRAPH